MATVDEAAGAKTPLGSDLAAGVDAISQNQTITFSRYIRVVLPLDGYVFWVRQNLIGNSALLNAFLLNGVGLNQAQEATSAPTLVAKGSLHYATEVHQDEAENFATNRVIFTSEQEVNDLNEMAPGTIWIAEFDGIKFAFSSRGSFYRQADLYHYVGFAVYADMATQVIDSPAGFDRDLIVTNSLPAWLALSAYNVPWGRPLGLPLYPSFLTPDNLIPPYAAVHVVPESTQALAAAPTLNRTTTSHFQLCTDRVKITLWGKRNDQALDFVDAVYQYSADTDVFGIMNLPTIRDEKRTQVELGTIAMKKTIEFEVSYLQTSIRDTARKLISSAFVTVTPQPKVTAPSLDFSNYRNSQYLPGL